MQLKDSAKKNGYQVAKGIIKNEGIRNFYKGMLPNVLRIVPSNALRFTIYDYLKNIFLGSIYIWFPTVMKAARMMRTWRNSKLCSPLLMLTAKIGFRAGC